MISREGEGKERALLSKRYMLSGMHECSWDATDNNGVRVPSGLYFVRIGSPVDARTDKVILLQ
jgi:flagellar hook assembly protein FlgD